MENYNFDPIKRGATFGPFSFSLEDEDGVKINITNVCMQLKKNPKGAAVHTFDFTYTDGIADSPAVILDIPPYNYVYDVKVTTEDGQVFTSETGIVPLIQNVSECQ